MLGLVLEGGGAKGSFHAGALKALSERGYRFSGVTGTSIGAINGAMVAQGEIYKCHQVWENLTPSAVMEIEDAKVEKLLNSNLDRETIMYFLRFLRQAVSNKGIPMDRAEAFLAQYIDEEKIRKSPIDFGIVTVSMTDDWMPVELFKEDIPQGMLLKFILASANFPAFRNNPIDGKKYMDGGIYDNLPINPLVRRGYTDIIAIRTMSNMPHQRVIDKSVKVDYIYPSEPLGRTLAFTNKNIKFNLNLGYYDALRFTDKLVGTKFYIIDMPDDEFYAYLENRYGLPLYKGWAELMDIKGNKAEIINHLIQQINNEIKESFTDYQAFLTFLEPYALAYGIEKFCVYTLQDFIDAIYEKYMEKGIVPLKIPKNDHTNYLQELFYTFIENHK